FARRHSASSAFASWLDHGRPLAATSASTARKRRANRAFAARRQVSGSSCKCRLKFATENSRSPSSAATWSRSPLAAAASSSASSSSTFARTPATSGQSKPTVAARLPSFTARVIAGRPTGTSSSRPASGEVEPRSSRFSSSHRFVCSALSATDAAPNTCGWRRSILSQIARATSANAKAPVSSAMRAWKTTWNSKSPSSSLSSKRSLRSIASATSYASSIVYGAIVANVCSTSHGQPRSRSRKRAMISSSRPSEAVSGFAFIEYHVLKVAEHGSRRAPDAAAAVVELVSQEPRPVPLEVADTHGAAVEDHAERHLEHAGHLARIRARNELAIRDDADDRPDDEARPGQELVERADHVDRARLETDFLVRLAQRGLCRSLAGCDAAAGQAD